MSSLFDRFEKEIKGKNDSISDFSSKLSSIADFTKYKGINVILNSWYNILTIPLETYDNEPTIGSNLYKYIFKYADNETLKNIKNEIKYRLNQDNRATISDINVLFFKNKKGFKVKISVNYKGDISNLDIEMSEIKYQNLL